MVARAGRACLSPTALRCKKMHAAAKRVKVWLEQGAAADTYEVHVLSVKSVVRLVVHHVLEAGTVAPLVVVCHDGCGGGQVLDDWGRGAGGASESCGRGCGVFC